MTLIPQGIKDRVPGRPGSIPVGFAQRDDRILYLDRREETKEAEIMHKIFLLLLFCFLVFCAAVMETTHSDGHQDSVCQSRQLDVSPRRTGNTVSGILSRLAERLLPEERIVLEEEVEITCPVLRGENFDAIGCRSNAWLMRQPPEFFEEPAEPQAPPVQSIAIQEEEGEITRDIPPHTTFDNLSQKNLNTTSCVDAYGILPVVEP
jgi:hypothetical protein